MAVQTGLCGTWSGTPKTSFLTTRLICSEVLSSLASTRKTKFFHSQFKHVPIKPIFGVTEQVRLKTNLQSFKVRILKFRNKKKTRGKLYVTIYHLINKYSDHNCTTAKANLRLCPFLCMAQNVLSWRGSFVAVRRL